jgi:hypothetical protein
MQVTILGMILLPLSLIWCFNPVRLTQLAFVVAPFEAAAAAVFGGFGLQLAMVPGVLFVAYILLQYALGMRYPGERGVFTLLFPLLAMLFYALFAAKLFPEIFAGQLSVFPQKTDPTVGVVPLAPSFGNVTQSLYLTIDILITTVVALFLTRRSIPYEGIIGGYMLGGYVEVIFVFWQLANSLAGVPFPEDLLHSNPGLAIVSQSIGSVPRMQGTFSEPAALSIYMSGVALCCLWLSVRGYRTMRPNILLALSISSVMLSTSTTGIVTLAVGLPTVLALASVGGDPGALSRVGKTVGALLLSGALVLTPIFILKPSLVESVATVVDSTLTKTDSDSYVERQESDRVAYNAALETYGLGIGWGSTRSSSLIPGILANGGIFSLMMLVLLGFRVRATAKKVRAKSSGNYPGRILVEGFSAALYGQLGAALLSAPSITSLVFYIQLGCVIGVLARNMSSVRSRPQNARMRDVLINPATSRSRSGLPSSMHASHTRNPSHWRQS